MPTSPLRWARRSIAAAVAPHGAVAGNIAPRPPRSKDQPPIGKRKLTISPAGAAGPVRGTGGAWTGVRED